MSYGSCGIGCTWNYNHTSKLLSIDGGTMTDISTTEPKWQAQMKKIEKVIITSTTNIGSNAFNGAT